MPVAAATICSASAYAHDSAANATSQQDQAPAVQGNANTADAKKVTQLEGVTVTGMRASLQKSLDLKRNADLIVDAISAEDVGKFPYTDVSESLSHLPGISVDRTFGEGDKVSILGTDPALNRLLLNGQTLASVHWTSDPNNPDSRLFDDSLLTSDIIGTAEVYKTPQARMDERSIGGTVIINTRRPLDLKANRLTGTFGYQYNDRAHKGEPQGSLLYSWKSNDNSFGVLGSVMHSDRLIQREGTEIFGYQRANDPTDTDPNHQFSPDVVPPRIRGARLSSYFTQIAQLQSSQISGIFRELDAQVGYQINDHMGVSLDGTHLLDETYEVYNNTPAQPLNAYRNGRTYTLNLGLTL